MLQRSWPSPGPTDHHHMTPGCSSSMELNRCVHIVHKTGPFTFSNAQKVVSSENTSLRVGKLRAAEFLSPQGVTRSMWAPTISPTFRELGWQAHEMDHTFRNAIREANSFKRSRIHWTMHVRTRDSASQWLHSVIIPHGWEPGSESDCFVHMGLVHPL